MSSVVDRSGAAERADGQGRPQLGPVDLAVLSNRLDRIVREMENTLLRTARSSVIGLARDFSCSIVTRDDELLASAEGTRAPRPTCRRPRTSTKKKR